MTAAHDGPRQSAPITKAQHEYLRRAAEPGFDRWQAVVRRGGCSNPIRLYVECSTIDTATVRQPHFVT